MDTNEAEEMAVARQTATTSTVTVESSTETRTVSSSGPQQVDAQESDQTRMISSTTTTTTTSTHEETRSTSVVDHSEILQENRIDTEEGTAETSGETESPVLVQHNIVIKHEDAELLTGESAQATSVDDGGEQATSTGGVQITDGGVETKINQNGEREAELVPLVPPPLSPSLVQPQPSVNHHHAAKEIEQESIKNALHEIISEIDREMDDDFAEEENPSALEVDEEPKDDENIDADNNNDMSVLLKSAEAAQRKRSPPPVAPKKARPVSMPHFPMATEGDDIGSPETGRPIDLQKIFTPATDSGEITPRRRRMFASSSFYAPTHPTMEEQVELARQISHSLSSETNSLSKGQTMYVKRRQRSFKWIHEGSSCSKKESEQYCSTEIVTENGATEEPLLAFKIPNVGPQEVKFREKSPLKLVMNPRGQVWDVNTIRHSGNLVDPPPLSPEICSSLVKDLHTPKGKGAALFAKRKQKSEKWIVDESSVKAQSVSAQQAAAPAEPEPPVPAAPQVTNNKKTEQMQKIAEVQERYGGPRVKLVKSPWEAALQDGTVDTAFQDLWQQSGNAESSSEPPVPAPWLKAAPIQPKLPLKPLDSVPKLLPSFKAQPPAVLETKTETLTEEETKPAAPVFVPGPVRPANVNPYKAKTPKGWGFGHAELNNEEPSIADITATNGHLTPLCNGSTLPAEEPPKEETKLILPALKPVPVEEKPEPIKTEPVLELPQLRPVPPPEETVPEPQNEEPVAPGWEPPPLDSRPGLQALLQRENQAAGQALQREADMPASDLSPSLKALLQNETGIKREELSEEARLAYEAELAKLSVRLKIKRFEGSTGRTPAQQSGLGSPASRWSGTSSPKVFRKSYVEPANLPVKENGIPARETVIYKETSSLKESFTVKQNGYFKESVKESSVLTDAGTVRDAVTLRSLNTGLDTANKDAGTLRDVKGTVVAPKMFAELPDAVALRSSTIVPDAVTLKALVKDAPKPSTSDSALKENAAPAKLPVIQTPPFVPMPAPEEPMAPPAPTQPIVPAAEKNLSSFAPAPAATLRQKLPPPLGKLSTSETDAALKRKSLADYSNYNTAPRGWKTSQDAYRPVTFKAT